MLTARIRNWGFWAFDFAQGSPIRKHCEDIETQLISGTKSAERLEALLHHAVDTTAFYAKYRGFSSLQDFPVIHKAAIKPQYEAFRSSAYQNARLRTMRTSGSTGTPFAVVQNQDKRRRVLAEMIYFGGKAGYQVGDRYIFTRCWTANNRKPLHVALSENAVMFDISSLDKGHVAALETLLRTDSGIRCMLGFPSTFVRLLQQLDQSGAPSEDFHLRSIISIAEALPREVRLALKSRFNCPVVARYSNQENGVLAQQCPNGDEFHLNTASYVFEFLKLEEDTPAGPGERARVVLTDLFNHAMPLIRYDTGDIVIRQNHATCGWATETLQDVEGRRLDFIYDTEDRPISPFAVCTLFWPFTELKQYQFVQEAKGRYEIVLNGANLHYKDDEFIRLAKDLVGADAVVSVTHVDQIPLLSSGKYRQVASHYRPSA
ncbi:capsular polysaccharide biosynthesis protein [Geothrix limicola]|uniref:Capsular polysaccharide biosynthesis protein n=1 Tax=Geothrix limicola TaxID=2927978 RepID=A0ABQ5QKH1_9BACT|nr:hypothetical protein [Geothrix limicola]GLH74835.1 capsular polysaccharide biosynthesis protein [Geothrix limicola]